MRSECDVMFNLVPEFATADAQVFWSNGCFTNMLDYGAEHLTLRHLDMPRNFFSGNNCVAEYGQLPTNFLLGVSTPCSDIDFRRQMRSRLGEPITVAGNPPVKFASASFEAENEPQTADLPALSDPGPPERLLQHRDAARHRGADLRDPVHLFVADGLRAPLVGALLALLLTEIGSDLAQRRDQEGSCRQRLGRRSRDALLVAGGTSPIFSRRTASSSGARDLWAFAPERSSRIRSCGGWDARSAGGRS